jgi:hypothetical protein
MFQEIDAVCRADCVYVVVDYDGHAVPGQGFLRDVPDSLLLGQASGSCELLGLVARRATRIWAGLMNSNTSKCGLYRSMVLKDLSERV